MAGSEKSDGAFRTIREVADWLGVPTHVLRFWESKFDQIAPVKGAGGRRYYRPEDMRLLGGIKVLLHEQGLPIRGVSQRIDSEGVEAVMSLSPNPDMTDSAAAPKTRRVIRQGEDDPEAFGTHPKDKTSAVAPPEPGPAASPRIDPLPEPEEPEPGQPGDGESSDQLGDGSEVPQPADEPVEEPLDGSGQPDIPPADHDSTTAPDTDPDVAPEPDLEPEPEEPAPASQPDRDGPAEEVAREDARSGDDPIVSGAALTESTAESSAAPGGPIVVRRENQRRLRRVIRKLRGLIEEVEGELRATETIVADD